MQAKQGVSLFLLAFGLGLGWCQSVSAAHPEYRVTVVGPPGSQPADINYAGVVVGNFPTGINSSRAFINRGKGMVILNSLCSRSCNVRAINDKGVVLGNWASASGQNRGFLYYHGKQRDIGTILGRRSSFSDINNAGYIVGSAEAPDFSNRGYLRAPDGKLKDIGTLPTESPSATPRALNNRNQITGASGPLLFPDPPFRAFLWTKGLMRDLGDFGFTPNEGLAINDRGQVTGSAALPFGFRNQTAFLYSKGRLIKIDTRPDNVDQFVSGEGINIHGHVVGSSDHLGGYIYRGRKMEALNALIDPKSGWDVRFPRAINDKGQIAAAAYRGGQSYAVRLDLIRPHFLSAPRDEADESAPLVTEPQSPEAAAEEEKAEARAQALETVIPVLQ
ncbi:hypothetical protein B0920_17380 [Massilia sp. KIM]|uniref:hypothetical protein n=1 Tax=Massilia sp. KIM TaxID=1955422 RepID=UPI00098FB5E5|nr:hypothetical protein [Massilia sp. KIM]OON60732.1 hypothetical protein B0920_17380 [Massilia sp. KIM]